MTAMHKTDGLFFSALDYDAAKKTVRSALEGCDDGELFLEYACSEHLALDDGRIKSAGYNASSGFGLRAVSGEAYAYALSNEISDAALKNAAQNVRPIRTASSPLYMPDMKQAEPLYTDAKP